MRAIKVVKVITIVMLIAGLLAVALAQTPAAREASTNSEKSDAIISTSTLMPVGLVITMIGLVATITVSMADARNHRQNTDIHHSGGDLQSLLKVKAEKSDCLLKHDKVDGSFVRVYEKFDEVRNDLGEVKTGVAEIKAILKQGE